MNIAIVGIGGIFPDATDLAAFWANILAGRSAAREAPAGRWLLPADEVFARNTEPDRVISKKACFIDHFRFNVNLFDVDDDLKQLLSKLDPMFHLLLHAGKQAWDDANTTAIDRSRTGIILGNIALPTDASSAMADEILGPAFAAALQKTTGIAGRPAPLQRTHPLNRYVAGLPAGVLARVLGLGGSTYTLDAACASSLYSLKLACDELTAGRADAMLAGGLSRPDSLYTQMGFSQLKALSPSGRCSPFDETADGLVVGEGCGIFVLKRLEDALRDGDHIYSLIRGFGLSNDIGGNLMLPDSQGQLRAMRAAYAQAGWSPGDVDLIECHGTGTPTGDAVEIESLRQLRASAATPAVIGSVKSNVGHLLTGAGAAGLMKVLFSIRDGVLPPTANRHRPAKSIANSRGLEVLSEARAWSGRHDQPRRAAISAFGFGGINAHVLIEEWLKSSPASAINPLRPSVKKTPPAIAIIGIGTNFGPWKTRDAFAHRVLRGDEQQPMSPGRWWGVDAGPFKGHFIREVSVPIGRFAIPPAELRDMLPQQLLMLQTADAAMTDAGLIDKNHRLRMGVFIGIGLDLNTTNFHFRWTMLQRARRWSREAQQELSESDLHQWAGELRDAAGPPLTANRTMGALGGIVASRVARAFHIGGPSHTISAEEASGLKAIEVAVRALHEGEIDSAIVGAVDLAGDLRAAIGQRDGRDNGALTTLGEGAGAFVLKRHEDALRDSDRIYALIRGIGTASCGLHANEAARSAAIAQSHNQAHTDAAIIPAAQAWSENSATTAESIGDCGAATGAASLARAALALHYDLLPHKGYWLRDRIDGPRRATVEAMGVDGSVVHLVLEEADKGTLPVGTQATGHASVSRQRPQTRHRQQVAGDIAFVFPGAGNQFIGMGRQLAARWPQVLRRQDEENLRLRSQFARGAFWSAAETNSISHRDVIFGQVCLGTMVTDIFAKFAVKPAAVIGYSLGETTSLFATRLWPAETSRDEMLRRMDESTLFTSDLTGRCDGARQAWGLREDEQIQWAIGVITCPRAKVEQAIAGRSRVYLLIVNAPMECVIGGDREAVLALAADLKCTLHPIEGVTTVHCEVIKPVMDAYRDLHLLETVSYKGSPRVYSGAWGQAYEVTRETAADAIVAQASGMIDFPRVVEAAYADGARYFIEVGPGASCTRMIGQILAGRPHIATAVCVQGKDEVQGIFSTLVLLEAHGFSVDWSGELQVAETMSEATRCITVHTGGLPFVVTAPSPSNPIEVAAGVAVVDNGKDSLAALPPQHVSASKAVPLSEVEQRWPAQDEAAQVSDLVTAAWSPLIEQMSATQIAQGEAQESFLRVSRGAILTMAGVMRFQGELLGTGATEAADIFDHTPWRHDADTKTPPISRPTTLEPVAFDRAMCMEFAVGSIGRMLGPQFAPIDAHPTRVRLPDEPLMLCDRILEVEGEPGSMTRGRCVTEHDIHPGAWYLDCGRIPTCIAVEAGQADLFLSGYLGIDFITKGHAVYRLLDAVVTFHGPLPHEGQVIRYDIRVNEFFRQGETYLFRFEFDATVDGQPVLTMRKGCAGFFTEAELAAGQGIVLTSIDKRVLPGVTTADWRWLSEQGTGARSHEGTKGDEQDHAPLHSTPDTRHPTPEVYSDAQIDALRRNDSRSLVDCFGGAFAGLALQSPVGLPGGGDGPAGRMKLVHRILRLDAKGGRFGLGQIVGEADIHGDDWFLTCHFVDDRVMPGTLMYECCLHTLRVLLLRMGWVGEQGEVVYEPIPEVPGQLKCRGQVNETTSKVQYEITVKEIGYGRQAPGTGTAARSYEGTEGENSTPYVIADALMYADGRAVVQMNNMSLRLTGLTREGLEAMWEGAEKRKNEKAKQREIGETKSAIRNPKSEMSSTRNSELETRNSSSPRPAIFDFASIYAFAAGNPSEAFGDRYKVFDHNRKIARLPRPPYQFLDRIVSINNCEQWKLAAGGVIEAEYDVPADAWYFASNRQNEMPFAVLLEVALQPCGWLAAYLGSALTSDTDLRFRNLGGSATQFLPVTPATGTLTTTIKITRVSQSGGMIIQNYDMSVRSAAGDVYRGDTYFGFFSADALRDQVGIRDAKLHHATADELKRSLPAFDYPDIAPFPDSTMRMVDRIDIFDPQGGPRGIGFIQGTTHVNPAAWFFEAHFYQDPVVPGSLGLESFVQLLKVVAAHRWGGEKFRVPSSEFRVDGIEDARAVGLPSSTRNPELATRNFQTPALNSKHTWVYRGQIIPKDEVVTVQAVVTEIDDVRRLIKADGFLSVDGRTIYQMKDFTLQFH